MKFSKVCIDCGSPFQAVGPAARYCSKACGQRYRYKNNMRTTAYQYSLRTGKWDAYYKLRLNEKGRRFTLTLEELLKLHEAQNGMCALTGIPMTCELVPGKRSLTNASIDRKQPGGAYTIDNIQLVCAGINRWRGEIPLDEFVRWCRKVVETHERKNRGE
jgi:hypothetical protein